MNYHQSRLTSVNYSQLISQVDDDIPQQHTRQSLSPIFSQYSSNETEFYHSCVAHSLDCLLNLPPLADVTQDLFFTKEKRTGNIATHRFTLRSNAKRLFNIFPWIVYITEKRRSLGDASLLRETIEEDYMNKIVEAMTYFYCEARPFLHRDLKFLKGIYEQLEWEKDKDKTLFTRILTVYVSFRQYRSTIAGIDEVISSNRV